MYLAYYDESGDDGYPNYSSQLFVLTSIYMRSEDWKNNYEKVKDFRRKLRQDYNFPIKMEFHTNKFVRNKKPYTDFRWNNTQRKNILLEFVRFLPSLTISTINVVINKPNIVDSEYAVLDRAFGYNIQRIDNDLKYNNGKHFMMITDEGRVGKMAKTSRRMQRINYIPSTLFPGETYRRNLGRLLEDPLPKNSSESYFIQISDLISYIVYIHSIWNYNKTPWPKRIQRVLDYKDTYNILTTLKPILNTKASRKCEFGIVHYPKTV